MESKRNTKDFTDSPMRSLSSFKDEIPGGDFPPPKDDDEHVEKSFQQKVQEVVNSSPFHITVILLVFAHCIILTAEFALVMAGGTPSESTLRALSSTCLVLLSFFVLEVTLRLVSTGCKLFKRRLEIFDVSVVVTTIVIDVLLYALKKDNEHRWTVALSYLILLRCWRLYSVYYVEVKKIRDDLRVDIEMAKYGRRQAEAQADALQSQRDTQLKEIFHLREFLHQHSLDPDPQMPESIRSSSPVRIPPGYNRTVSIDRADTMREQTRLYPAPSVESAISSIGENKHVQVTAEQNEAPSYRETEETTEDEGKQEDETEIRSLVSEEDMYESAEEEGNKEGDDKDLDKESQKDELDEEEERPSTEGKEAVEETLQDSEEDVKVKVERELPVGSANRERVISSTMSEGGIDNLAFEGDDTLQSEEEEVQVSAKDSPSKGSASRESRCRSDSELVSVTEDVNGVPMTSL